MLQKYAILGAICLTVFSYATYLKLQNVNLQNDVAELSASKVQLERALELQMELTELAKQKNEKLLVDFQKLKNPPKITKTEKIDVPSGFIEVSNLDSQTKEATGIPLFLGNIGE